MCAPHTARRGENRAAQYFRGRSSTGERPVCTRLMQVRFLSIPPFGGVAQRLRRSLWERDVGGSNPSAPTNSLTLRDCRRWPPKPDVGGSSPPVSTNVPAQSCACCESDFETPSCSMD